MIETFDPVDRFVDFNGTAQTRRINKLRRARRPSLSFAGTSARVAGRLVASFRGDARDVEIPELSEGSGRRFPVGTCAPIRIACLEFPPNSPPRRGNILSTEPDVPSPPLHAAGTLAVQAQSIEAREVEETAAGASRGRRGCGVAHRRDLGASRFSGRVERRFRPGGGARGAGGRVPVRFRAP